MNENIDFLINLLMKRIKDFKKKNKLFFESKIVNSIDAINKFKQLSIVKGFIKKLERWGEFYCPCRSDLFYDLNDDQDIFRNRDYICPCKNTLKEVNENGHCRCRLFFKRKQLK